MGLRDRALIGLLVYSFARIGAALAMKVEDYYPQGRRMWVRLHEKGGKRHDMPCHHSLEEYLDAYIQSAGIADDPKGALFRTISRGPGKRHLSETPLPQANAYAMVQRHAMDTWEQGGDYRDRVLGDARISGVLAKEEIERAFSLETYS